TSRSRQFRRVSDAQVLIPRFVLLSSRRASECPEICFMATSQPSEVDVVMLPGSAQQKKINLVLVSSVALSFISFWRAAAIVLNDMASTVYYIGGISEQAIGKAAPWFVLGVMLFAYAVRALYVESCTMITRGVVYLIVKEAMGRPLAM